MGYAQRVCGRLNDQKGVTMPSEEGSTRRTNSRHISEEALRLAAQVSKLPPRIRFLFLEELSELIGEDVVIRQGAASRILPGGP